VRSTWREQVGVGAEVALERVLEDHEPVRGAVAGDGRAVVLAVGAHLRAASETTTGTWSITYCLAGRGGSAEIGQRSLR
jgi:hypothetical protein